MKKKTRNRIAVLLIASLTLLVLTVGALAAGANFAAMNGQTSAPEGANIIVSYNAGEGTATINPSDLGIDAGSSVTMLILKPGTDTDNITNADIVWIDQKKVTADSAASLVFAFKFRNPEPGQYIVKLGGTGVTPVESGFAVN